MPSPRARFLFLIVAAALAVVLPQTAAHADPSPAQVQQRIADESDALERTVEQYNAVTEDLHATQARADAQAAQLVAVSAQLDAASAQINAIAARAYMSAGSIATASAVLSAGEPGTLVDRLVTLDLVAAGQRSTIESYARTKAAADAATAEVQALLTQRNAQQQALAVQKAQIESRLAELYQLRRQVYGQAQTTASRYTGPVPDVSGAAGVAVRFAYAALGTPYQWGAAGPSGYDCSGLTMAAWAAAGRSLPHNAARQWSALPHLSRADLAPGDLVFYASLGHVGIYVGNGQIIHAPHAGDVVRLASVDVMSPYGYARP